MEKYNQWTQEVMKSMIISTILPAKGVHQTNFSFDIFKIAAVSKVSPQRLGREEFRHIENTGQAGFLVCLKESSK